MGIFRQSPRAAPASQTSVVRRHNLHWPLFASSAILCALSIALFGLLSSMVAWLLDQKHNVHSYRVNWPGNPVQLNVEPKNLWADQGHESNGLGVYGFFLGVFGMVTAWRMSKAGQVWQMDRSHLSEHGTDDYQQARKSVNALAILLLLGTMFSLSAFIFAFVVTYQTSGRHIREPVALNSVGINYSYQTWTPETWFKAVLELPLADGAKHAEIKSQVRGMVAWRWILLPLFLMYMVALYIAAVAWLRQRRHVTERTSSAQSVEKTGSR